MKNIYYLTVFFVIISCSDKHVDIEFDKDVKLNTFKTTEARCKALGIEPININISFPDSYKESNSKNNYLILSDGNESISIGSCEIKDSEISLSLDNESLIDKDLEGDEIYNYFYSQTLPVQKEVTEEILDQLQLQILNSGMEIHYKPKTSTVKFRGKEVAFNTCVFYNKNQGTDFYQASIITILNPYDVNKSLLFVYQSSVDKDEEPSDLFYKSDFYKIINTIEFKDGDKYH
jgi:hypothetical protein